MSRAVESDAQGIVFSGFGRFRASAIVLVDFENGDPSDWLRRLVPIISSGRAARRPAPYHVNVALTFEGLRQLGLDASALAAFPSEFREGMAHPARAALLGDVGQDGPEHWEFGAGTDRVHAVLLLYARSELALDAALGAQERAFDRFDVSRRVLRTFLPEDRRGHFGFRMGVSEPSLRRRERHRSRERVPLGEVLLGHRNAYGERAPIPTAPLLASTRDLGLTLGTPRVPFGKNGSFLVLRKLEQRVDEFWGFTAQRAALTGVDPVTCASHLMGRWPNGASLVHYPDAEPADERALAGPVRYAEDAEGIRCPLDAHARRANPGERLGRGALAHRILRRGRLYGPKVRAPLTTSAGAERGLAFLALNADLSRQFETVQACFLNGHGGFGPPPEVGLSRFVRMRGGLYAFLPSVSALNYLADISREA